MRRAGLTCLLVVWLSACSSSPTAEPHATALDLARALTGREEMGHDDVTSLLGDLRGSGTLDAEVYAQALSEPSLSTDAFSLLVATLHAGGETRFTDLAEAAAYLEQTGLGLPFDHDNDGRVSPAEAAVYVSRANPVSASLFEYERPLGPLRPAPLPW